MAKEIKAVVDIQIPAGKATPAPPIGPALAKYGLNMGEFCQKFNDATKEMSGFIVPTSVTIYADRTYTYRLKSPLASELLKKAAGIEKGSGTPNKKKVGTVTKSQIKEIAQKKIEDLNTKDIEQAMKIIAGTAKNMGIEIKE
ncbi:MAG: 50S ribosomal protein L11 [Candidatus Staskawiczbacteria bacterium]|nr:50S ribosomal protein L11 [Candidatus Staskawiczbacteria bacterium]MBI3337071.1 50S ribosomal protein L11 [Candidatus Staskawiczbacteria bacterium]